MFASFCSNHALQKNAELFGTCFDEAVTEASFYVDDCLASFATYVEKVKFTRDASELIAHGGFQIRKQTSC